MTAEIRQMLVQAQASGNPDAILRAGAMALQGGGEAEAAPAVAQAVRDHPDHPQLWQLLGLLHRTLDDHAPAVNAFARAAALAPGDPMIAHGRACVCFEAGLPAASLFAEARRLNQPDRAMLLRHAAARIAEGDGEAAMAEIEAELMRNPRWLEGHAALARLRWARGAQEEFDASYAAAVAAAPGEAALWRAWLDALLHDGLHARALEVVERARAAAGPNEGFDAAEAVARSELGELERAGALFAGLAGVRDPSLLVHHVRHLFRAGRIAEATELAHRNAPRDPTAHLWSYVSIGWRLLGDPRWEWLEGDPRFIGVYDLADRLPPLDALADRLRALHIATHQPLDQSVRGGTQTEGHLFSRIAPEIRALRQACAEAVQRHVAQLPPPQPGHPLLLQQRAPIRFAGSWSVRLAGGGNHIDHFHPSGWLSSAFYISLPGAAERGEGEAGWLTLGRVTELGLDLPPLRTIEPKPGRLILFPSTMWHGTRPFESGERLAVAFDVRRPA